MAGIWNLGSSEFSCSPCSRGLRDATSSVDRNGQYDDDADWFDGNPNRVGGSVITGTDATVAQSCSYKKKRNPKRRFGIQ